MWFTKSLEGSKKVRTQIIKTQNKEELLNFMKNIKIKITKSLKTTKKEI